MIFKLLVGEQKERFDFSGKDINGFRVEVTQFLHSITDFTEKPNIDVWDKDLEDFVSLRSFDQLYDKATIKTNVRKSVAPLLQPVQQGGNTTTKEGGSEQRKLPTGRISLEKMDGDSKYSMARSYAAELLTEDFRVDVDKLTELYENCGRNKQFVGTTLSFLPYELVLGLQQHGQQYSWHHLLMGDVLNTCILRDEWDLRHQYLRGNTPKTGSQLLEVYDEQGLLNCDLFRPRPLFDDELKHPRIPPTDVYPRCTEGDRLLISTLGGFQHLFNYFSSNVLTGLNWKGIFAAGGSVLACLQCWRAMTFSATYEASDKLVALTQVLCNNQRYSVPFDVLNLIHSYFTPTMHEESAVHAELKPPAHENGGNTISNSDVDLFLVVDSEQEAMERVKHIVHTIANNAQKGFGKQKDEIRIIRTSNTITVWCGWPVRTIQIVVILYRTPHEVLSFFDLDCVAVGYDGSNVHMLPRSVRAINTGYNFVEPAKLRRWSTGPRIVKYTNRGFGTVFFEICKHTPRCDVILDAEMAEKIASVQARVSTVEEMGYGVVELPRCSRLYKGETLDMYLEAHFPSSGNIKWLFSTYMTADNFVPNQFPPTQRSQRAVLPSFTADSTALDTPLQQEGKQFYTNSQWVYGKFDQLDDILKYEGMAGVRWKNDDLLYTSHGNEFLPPCYMCRNRIDPTITEKERPLVCKSCEDINKRKCDATVDLSGRLALVTGGRIKIGFSVALKLLRCGATVCVTTRFPLSALYNYTQQTDWSEWRHRLHIYGLDFRHVPSVREFISSFKRQYSSLDILVNNAAQTIRRPPDYYKTLLQQEINIAQQFSESTSDVQVDDVVTYVGSNTTLAVEHVVATIKAEKYITNQPTESSVYTKEGDSSLPCLSSLLTQVPLLDKDEQLVDTTLFPHGKKGVDGEQLDLRSNTSWNMNIGEVPLIETFEVHTINAVVPMTLVNSFVPLLTNRTDNNKHRFVINVTSPEGQFASIKTGTHPHTNMAKAALNMLTKTVAGGLVKENVFVNSVDTGWVSIMTPAGKVPEWGQRFPAPLTVEDGAARVLDPIITGVVAEATNAATQSGALFRHFKEAQW